MNNKQQIVLRSYKIDRIKELVAGYWQSIDPKNPFADNRDKRRHASNLVGVMGGIIAKHYPNFNPNEYPKAVK